MAAPNPEPGDKPGDLGDHDEPRPGATPSPDAVPGAGRPADDLPDADVEARWADIVAQLGELGTTRSGPAPADDSADDGSADHDRHGDDVVVRPASGPRDWPTTPEVEALEETESHFTPPEPEPVLSRSPLLTLAWALVVGVPVLTVLLVIVRALVPGLHVPALLGPSGGVLFLFGVAVLIWRMPHHRDPGDPGNGAVV